MKYITLPLLLLFNASAQSNEITMLADLNSLQWKNRVIVVNHVQNEEKVLALFKKNSVEIDERDIIWFVIKDDRIFTNYSGELAEQLVSGIGTNYDLGRGEAILIGKDGATKVRLNRVDLTRIFSEIDAMPMRQTEMRN